MSIFQYGSGGEEDEELYHDCIDIDEESEFDITNVYHDDIEIIQDDLASLHVHESMHDVGADDSILTTQKLDMLAAKLGRSWKRFARITEMFSEGDIYDIEYSCHSIYERCYQMIILWQRKSREVITVSMVSSILMAIERNDLARDLIGEDSQFYLLQSIAPQQTIDYLCNDWNWKRFARQTGLFSEIDLDNIDTEETDVYEKCHKMLMLWQERSISALTLDDFDLIRTKEGPQEKVIKYRIDNGIDIRKMKVRAHHALQEMNEELMHMDKNLSVQKVQYIDVCNGDTITCDSEAQLDLAIYDENVSDFNIVTKRNWWLVLANLAV